MFIYTSYPQTVQAKEISSKASVSPSMDASEVASHVRDQRIALLHVSKFMIDINLSRHKIFTGQINE